MMGRLGNSLLCVFALISLCILSEACSWRNTSSLTNTSGSKEKNNTPDIEVLTINVKGIEFKMVKVKGGTFLMGSVWEEEQGIPYVPYHAFGKYQVTLSDYYIGQTEVTQALWEVVMGNNPSKHKGNNQRPVENVSWYDCQAFIKELNHLTGMAFRLPTEAEWEFAARGGNKSKGYRYSGSNSAKKVACYHIKGKEYKTMPVATKKANELGLYDMSGNVSEWCNDWYAPYPKEPRTNPQGGVDTELERVVRGGHYLCGYIMKVMRPSWRSLSNPERGWEDTGFRLAL